MTKNNNILPQDWTAKPINQVFEFIGTSSFSRNDINYEIDHNSIYYIHYGDIHATYKNAVLDFDNETRIPVLKKHIKPSTNFLKEGDLIIADASEDYEGVGEALEVYNIEDKKVLAGLHTFALRDKNNETAHGYRAYLFKNPEVKKRLKTIATGSKVYGISKGNLEKFKIILPPLSEQQKIAKILASWDRAIKLQEQLIDNKKKYKKAVMQKLLTGEVRFKGFSQEWKEVRLGKIGEIINGLTYKPENVVSSGTLVLRSSNIKKNKIDLQDKVYVNVNDYNPLKDGDILICVRNGSRNLIGKNAIISNESKGNAFGAFMTVYRSDFNNFFVHLFSSDIFKKEVQKNLGATINSINNSDLKKFKLPFPELEEQKKIASFLSGIDKETKALENELISFQKQKKGLMQQLLTGKLRIIK